MNNVLKKPLAILLVFALCSFSVVFHVSAATTGTCGTNLTWSLSDDGTLTIKGYGDMFNYSESTPAPWHDNRNKIQTINLNTYVTSIGDYAFYGCENLKTVTDTKYLTKIGAYAFAECINLSELKLDSVTSSLGEKALYHCKSLTVYGYSDIASYVMSACESQDVTFTAYQLIQSDSFVVPAANTINWSFYDSGRLTIGAYNSIYVEGPIAELKKYSDRITEIKISVVSGFQSNSGSIPTFLFQIAPNVECISFNGMVKYAIINQYFDKALLTDLKKLKRIDVSASFNAYECSSNGILYNIDKTELLLYPANKEILTQDFETLLESVSVLSDGCVPYNDTPTEIIIPENIVEIKGNPFVGCSNLTAVTVSPDNKYFKSVDGVLFNNDMTQLICYPAGKAGTQYTVPSTVTSITAGAFEGCCNLTEILLPEGITSIPARAFKNCEKLFRINIPAAVTSLGSNILSGCSSMDSLHISKNIKNLQYDSFYNSSLTSFTVDPENASFSCEDGSLLDKNKTTLIQCPPGTSGTFSLPECVTSLESNSYLGCSQITKLVINASLSFWNPRFINKCTSLMDIEVNSGHQNLYSIDGVIFSKSTNALLCFPCGRTGKYVLPANTAEISQYAFYNSDISEVLCNNSLIAMDSPAFQSCENLDKVIVPGADVAYNYSFNYCKPFTLYGYSGSTTEQYVNSYGKNSTSECAFQGIEAIADGKCGENLTWTVSTDHILKISGNGNMADFSQAPWLAYKDSIAFIDIANTVTSIGRNAFKDLKIESILIPHSIIAIGAGSFSGCENLAEIKVDTENPSYQTIDGVLFDKVKNELVYCPAAVTGEYTVPENVESIAEDAFAGCKDIILLGNAYVQEYAGKHNIPFKNKNTGNIFIRLAGRNRYVTSTAISAEGWEHADTVILANAAEYADALSGASLAGALNAPILLIDQNTINSFVEEEIARLEAKNIIILGGVNAISSETEEHLSQSYAVKRISGANRYLTSLAVAQQLTKDSNTDTAIIVTGTGYADAISISSYAAMKKYPVLYSNPVTGLSPEIITYLNEVENVIIIGGKNAVPLLVDEQLQDKTISRISGRTRYLTSYKIAHTLSSAFGNNIVIATGNNFPDALSGSSFAAKNQAPVLLTDTTGLIPEMKEYILNTGENGTIYILGGDKAVPDSILIDIDK